MTSYGEVKYIKAVMAHVEFQNENILATVHLLVALMLQLKFYINLISGSGVVQVTC